MRPPVHCTIRLKNLYRQAKGQEDRQTERQILEFVRKTDPDLPVNHDYSHGDFLGYSTTKQVGVPTAGSYRCVTTYQYLATNLETNT